MAACQGAFNDKHIRSSSIFFIPHAKEQRGRFAAGYDRGDCRIAVAGQLWKLHRKPGAAYHKIRSGPDGGLHMVGIVLKSHHHIDSHKSSASFSRLFCKPYMFFDCPQIGALNILFKIRFVISDLGGGDYSHASCLSHRPGKSAAADSHAHSSLNDGDAGRFVFDP